jgi:phenylpyruvate tautomerase PptA (4-oxalocrotonate tautomerase family)/quinol monooxygenase YgiN
MPIARLSLFSGRDSVVKGFRARGIIDVVSEIAGTSREGVHVLFDEFETDQWAIGPRLRSAQNAPERPQWLPAYVSVSQVRLIPGMLDAYLAWRRDSVYPFMASHEGFISSTLLSDPGDADVFTVINKWASRAARAAYQADPGESELRAQARELLSQLATDALAGDVVDVFHRRNG